MKFCFVKKKEREKRIHETRRKQTGYPTNESARAAVRTRSEVGVLPSPPPLPFLPVSNIVELDVSVGRVSGHRSSFLSKNSPASTLSCVFLTSKVGVTRVCGVTQSQKKRTRLSSSPSRWVSREFLSMLRKRGTEGRGRKGKEKKRKGKKKRERKINISRDDEPTRWASNQFRSCTRRICASLTRETEKKRPLRALLFLLPLLLLFLFLLLLLSLSLSRNWSWNRFQAG